MASNLCRVFFFLFLVRAVYQEDTEVDKYTNLVKRVQRFYDASSVFFVESDSHEDITPSLTYIWSRAFSDKRLLSMAMTMKTLANAGIEYSHPHMRPLYVVLLTRKESFEEFVNVTQHISRWISDPIWFIMFIEYRGTKPLENVCSSPTRNVFNVNFKTEMLVLCYDMPILREWYAIDNDETRISDLVLWQPNKGREGNIQILRNESLYARRNNLLNMTFRIATVQGSSFVQVENKTILHGVIGKIVHELSRALNFSIVLLEPSESYGSWDPASLSWSGVISEVINDKADLGAAVFTMTNSRLSAVDFTLPLLLSKNRLYFRQWRNGTVKWEAYFQAFDYKIWTLIVIIIITSPLLITWIKSKTSVKFDLDIYATVIDSYTHVFGIYCQQGLSEFPTQDSLKTAYLSIFLSALIIYSTYSASLISYLTVSTPSLPFSSFEDFARDRSYKLIVFKDSADFDMFHKSTSPTLLDMMKLMKLEKDLPLTLEDGFRQVCSEKVAFYTTEVLRQTLDVSCKIVSIDSGSSDSLAMILEKNSPYTGIINYQLQRFQDNGMLTRIRKSYTKVHEHTKSVHPVVDLWSIAPILAIVIGGYLSALAVLAFERFFDGCKKRNSLILIKQQRRYHKTGRILEGFPTNPNHIPTIKLNYWPQRRTTWKNQ